MDYEINLTNNELYFPRTERWIIDSFGLDLESAVLYQMILNKDYVTWTLDWLAHVMGWSRMKLIRKLDNMVEQGILYRRTVSVQGSTRKRTVYIAMYTQEGKRSDETILTLFKKGLYHIQCDYSGYKNYRRKN